MPIPSALQGKTIAVFGYGSQGHAQAQNLRDSGYDVIIGLDPERGSAKQARADGMIVVAPAEAAKRADWIQILTPDETQADFYESAIKPHLRKGKILGFSHGFSDSLQDHQASEGCGRGHDRAQGPGPSGAARVFAGRRRALVAGHPPGCQRTRA